MTKRTMAGNIGSRQPTNGPSIEASAAFKVSCTEIITGSKWEIAQQTRFSVAEFLNYTTPKNTMTEWVIKPTNKSRVKWIHFPGNNVSFLSPINTNIYPHWI
jgi:hypothetical protein